MKKRELGWLMLMAMILASCNLTSKNPLDTPADKVVDPAPYIGKWDLADVAGKTPKQPLQLSVTNNQSGTLIATYTDTQASSTNTFLLTQVSNRTIVSLRDDQGIWNIMRATLEDNGTTLVLSTLDIRIVSKDIQTAKLAGEVVEIDKNDSLVRVKASGAQIRAYLSTKTNIFQRALIFHKTP